MNPMNSMNSIHQKAKRESLFYHISDILIECEELKISTKPFLSEVKKLKAKAIHQRRIYEEKKKLEAEQEEKSCFEQLLLIERELREQYKKVGLLETRNANINKNHNLLETEYLKIHDRLRLLEKNYDDLNREYINIKNKQNG